jgi:hypothetical protein
MSQLSASGKLQLIAKINDGSFVLGDLSIDRCPKLETGEVSSEVLKQIYERMVDEVFKTFHLDKTEAMSCFRKCVKKLARGKPLKATSLDEYDGWNNVKKHLKTAMELQSQTQHPTCIPAPHLVTIIALLTIRRVRINTNSFAEDNQPFASLFGHCRMSQWLPIAIKFYEQMHDKPFILRTSRRTIEPILAKKICNGNEFWVVSTNSPSPSGPRALPAQMVEQIKGLATNGMMSGTDVAPVDSKGAGEDEPIFLIFTTTRAEARQSGADVLDKLEQPGINQASLKRGLDMWLSESYIRVMPHEAKNQLLFWCSHHSSSWCELIRSCLNEDRETWHREVQDPDADLLSS